LGEDVLKWRYRLWAVMLSKVETRIRQLWRIFSFNPLNILVQINWDESVVLNSLLPMEGMTGSQDVVGVSSFANVGDVLGGSDVLLSDTSARRAGISTLNVLGGSDVLLSDTGDTRAGTTVLNVLGRRRLTDTGTPDIKSPTIPSDTSGKSSNTPG
jgi:hypothetical protein